MQKRPETVWGINNIFGNNSKSLINLWFQLRAWNVEHWLVWCVLVKCQKDETVLSLSMYSLSASVIMKEVVCMYLCDCEWKYGMRLFQSSRRVYTVQTVNVRSFCIFYVSLKLSSFLFLLYLYSPVFSSPSTCSLYQTEWGERVRTTLLAAVLAVESLHKTEICTGSGQSHDQIKSSQVSSREPIHSHHKNGSLFVFSVRQSIVGHLARLRHWDIPPVHKSPSHLSLFFLLNSASLVVSLSVSWCIMWDLFPNILLWNVLRVFLFWRGIYSPIRRVMYTEAFYILTLGNRVFSDIFHPGLRLIHVSIHSLL